MSNDGSKTRLKKIVWGRLDNANLSVRVAALVFVVVGIVSMVFSQLAFFNLCVIDGKAVYLLLILAPLFLGAYLFGPLTGALLGLYAGAILFTHAQIMPLDYYEAYFMTPLHTFALLTVVGGCAGWLFSLIDRRFSKRKARLGVTALACVCLSFAVSGLMAACTFAYYGMITDADFETIGTVLLNSPLGLVVQASVDSVLAIVLCFASEAVVKRIEANEGERTILSMFLGWILLVSAVVFMITGAIVFSATTMQARSNADVDMQSEVDYLAVQANMVDSSDYDTLLNGYSTALDGYVVILDQQGSIVSTNDPGRYPKGEYFADMIGYSPDNPDVDRTEYASKLFGFVADQKESMIMQAVGPDGKATMDIAFLSAANYSGGYTAILRSDDMVYANRPGTMAIITLLALLLIVALAALATVLLNRVVVRRIDETNASLASIAAGDLAERVEVRDSKEFSSLAYGINTTVSALSDMIDEVARRNEQDLATAKTIQESALPRKFPPFPDIDRFDVYASMKTAREVGGDFYDFFLIEGTEKAAFIMADVSGKGIPAALFMMAAKSQLRTYLEAGLPVDEAVGSANRQLCEGNDAGMFVTAWVGVLDYQTGELTFVNAGHNPPLQLHDGSWEWVRDVSGMPLGLFDGIPYDLHTLTLEAKGVLYAYTDGVTEAMNVKGELFGEERLLAVLHNVKNADPHAIVDTVNDAVADHARDAERSDDITMLALKYGVGPDLS